MSASGERLNLAYEIPCIDSCLRHSYVINQGRLEEVHGQAHFAINDPVEAVACNANDQLVTTTHSGVIACFNTARKNWERLWRFDLRNAIPHALTFDPTGASVNVFALESGEQYVLRYFTLAEVLTRISQDIPSPPKTAPS